MSMNRETKTNFDKRSKHGESLCQKSNMNVITWKKKETEGKKLSQISKKPTFLKVQVLEM